MIMINGCFPAFLFCISRKRGTNRSITFFAYAFGINKQFIHLLKLFAILVFFQVPTFIEYIHIVHKENRGMLQLCLILIIFLCFFVLPKNIFMGNEIFSATFEFFAIADEMSTFYVHNSHMSPDNKKN